MKGEKGGKTNKATELLYKLSLRDDFKYEVQVLRLKHGIPKNGFKNDDERREWQEKDNAVEFYGFMLSTMEHYKIPSNYVVPFQEYVESNQLDTKTKQLDHVGFIDRYAHRKDLKQGSIEDWYIAKEEPFVKLILLGNTSKADVHAFIDANWETIEEVLGEQGDNPDKRVKKRKHKDRDRLIIELSKKTNDELRKILGPDRTSANLKQNLIRDILKKNEYGNITVSDDQVKKIMYQYKK